MTKLERLKKKEADKAQAIVDKEKALLDALAALKGEKREVSAEVREEERQQRNKRRYHVGALVDASGLFELDNEVLQPLFRLLGRARQIPDLVKVLEEALDDWLLPEEQEPEKSVDQELEELVSRL